MKFLTILAVASSFGLAACSTSNTSSGNASAPKADVKKEMVQFYALLGSTINTKDGDLNQYEADAAKDPKVTISPDEKTKAGQSAAAVATALKNVKIPASLNGQKTDLEAAIRDYINSYQMKADELKKDTPLLKGADTLFQNGDEILGKAFKSVDLLPASLDKQVN